MFGMMEFVLEISSNEVHYIGTFHRKHDIPPCNSQIKSFYYYDYYYDYYYYYIDNEKNRIIFMPSKSTVQCCKGYVRGSNK